jgi:chemotaxis methyl-accepting protein methylase
VVIWSVASTCPSISEEANRSLSAGSPQVSFGVGDILKLSASRYDAILCRGVLNDLVDEDARSSAFASFGRALRKGGVLVLDVREWDATAARKSREPGIVPHSVKATR